MKYYLLSNKENILIYLYSYISLLLLHIISQPTIVGGPMRISRESFSFWVKPNSSTKLSASSTEDSSSSFSSMAPLAFDGYNYQGWVVRIEAYLEGLWSVGNNEGRLWNSCSSKQPNPVSNEGSEGKEDKESEGQVMFIVWSLSVNLQLNYDPSIIKRHLKFPPGSVQGWWED